MLEQEATAQLPLPADTIIASVEETEESTDQPIDAESTAESDNTMYDVAIAAAASDATTAAVAVTDNESDVQAVHRTYQEAAEVFGCYDRVPKTALLRHLDVSRPA